jgi:HAD superfamily hydrolase (TIGR01509 family)
MLQMSDIKAVFFDQDGVILDTERDGHRVSFNKVFEEFGFDIHWDVKFYHQLLQVGGGKERMKHYLHTEGFGKEIHPDQEDELIKTLHQRKTSIFIEMIESGQLPLRPGVHRIMREVNEKRLTLGVCTTSTERAAQAVVKNVLDDIQFEVVLAGDVVKNKKPDPEIYQLALERTGLESGVCIVFEDSSNGVKAAKAAGMNVVATVNEYTRDEDLNLADIIVSCLGDEGSEQAELLYSKREFRTDGVIHLSDLIGYFEQ